MLCVRRQEDHGGGGSDDVDTGHGTQTCDAISDLVGSGTFEFWLVSDPASGDGDGPGSRRVADVVIMEPPPERAVNARRTGDAGNDHNGIDNNRTYFTKKPLCRMTCSVSDSSVLDEVTSRMLGPGTDFASMRIDARSARRTICLLANVTHSVLMPAHGTVQLGMVVVDVLDADTGRSLRLDEMQSLAAASHRRSMPEP